MKLINNISQAPKMWSVRFMTLAAIIQTAYATLPAELLASIPPNVISYVTLASLVAGIVGRMLAQEGISDESK